MKALLLLSLVILLFGSGSLTAHQIGRNELPLHEWKLKNGETVRGSYLLQKGGTVFLQDEHSAVQRFDVGQFSTADAAWLQKKEAEIEQLNLPLTPVRSTSPKKESLPIGKLFFLLPVLLLLVILAWKRGGAKRFTYSIFFLLSGVAGMLFGFRYSALHQLTSVTDPLSVDSAFTPFKPNVITSWDTAWFYVESNGIPSHSMMTGIVSWQQQVPIPQCYFKPNAWMIPLNPVVAPSPIPVTSPHFSRGAIGIAANGVPIFAPYTNTGVDALADGQLDNWGGHSGRADDYHYHIAPLHLYGSTASTLPCAYALDGFAVYGAYEPDGSVMLPLDTNHGHWGANGVYHYHGTATSPYMIGNFVGQVTEDTTYQLVPQPRAHPVRPALTPLSGAVITNFASLGYNGYVLTYTLSGQTYQVSYSWTQAGVYTFDFISPTGTTTSVYNGFVPCQIVNSIQELHIQSDRMIYPNPAGHEISIRLPDGVEAPDVRGIEVYAAGGQLVCRLDRFVERMALPGLTPGLYFVALKTATGRITGKFVVE